MPAGTDAGTGTAANARPFASVVTDFKSKVAPITFRLHSPGNGSGAPGTAVSVSARNPGVLAGAPEPPRKNVVLANGTDSACTCGTPKLPGDPAPYAVANASDVVPM